MLSQFVEFAEDWGKPGTALGLFAESAVIGGQIHRYLMEKQLREIDLYISRRTKRERTEYRDDSSVCTKFLHFVLTKRAQ